MRSARVGMGMPVYNGEEYIEESLRANLAQTYGDFVLCISDNASTDRTGEICRDYAAKDKRILYARNPVNVGAAGNYAKCFHPVECEYFRWSNADDIPEPTLVEKCLKVLEGDKSIVLAYGKSRIIDGKGAVLEDCEDNLHLPQASAKERFIACLRQVGLNNVIYGLMRRDVLSRTALLKGFPGADINLLAELCLYGKFHEIPERLFLRRMHPQASSWDRKDTERQMNFWDPLTKEPALEGIRATREFYAAVLRSPIPAAEKLGLGLYLAKKAYWTKNLILGDIRDWVRYRLAGVAGRKPEGK